MSNKEILKFDAEVGKVLQLMIHSLYTNKDIFLRELISNSSDACDKLRYMAITNPALTEGGSDFKITISADEKSRTLTIKDNGIGMNRQDLIDNLGTIASSGTQKFINQLSGDNKTDVQQIGQFGVGFYSAFMVADEVTVISRKAGETEGWIWRSKGTGEFSIEAAEGTSERGVTIHLHLKEGQDEYLDAFRIRHIVTTYSDHISIPIEMSKEDGSSDVLNQGTALWARSKSDITTEQYNEFYKHVSYSPDKPWLVMHNKNEGAVEYTNLLFVPSRKPFDLFHPDRKARVKLYVKKVFIADEGIGVVPAWMRFLRGVVDSEDLPLNISRETLQHNQVIEKIKKSLIKKLLGELKKKLENDRTTYEEFWQNFGAVLKEGLCEGLENREAILEICLFKSALTGKMITVDEYISSMQEGQTQIYYYLSGENTDAALSNPQLEGFLKRNIDVLLFSDNVDDFWVNVEHQFKEKELKSVTRSGIDLDNINQTNESKKEEISTPSDEKLIEHFKKVLASVVSEVKLSHRLVDSPVCLTVADGAMDIRMERFLIEQKQLVQGAAKTLEINAKHPVISKISTMIDSGNEMADEVVLMLYDQACILEGEPIHDASAFAKRMSGFLEKAVLAA